MTETDVSAVESEIVSRLRRIYGSPLRGHHDWDHIEYMIDILDEHAGRIHEMGMLRRAVWFHDAVCDSRAHDNEERSAQLAREWLSDICPDWMLDDIDTAILATKRHLLPLTLARPEFVSDVAWLLDADLAILGDEPARFDAYDRGTRFEYAWASDEDWAAGRSGFMQTLLDRPTIFHTKEMRMEREEQARSNIARLIASLTTDAAVRP